MVGVVRVGSGRRSRKRMRSDMEERVVERKSGEEGGLKGGRGFKVGKAVVGQCMYASKSEFTALLSKSPCL